MYKYFFKRLMDFFISLSCLLVLLPFLLFLIIWLHYANDGAGVFYVKKRPGKNGKIFKLLKFKSMTDARDEKGILLPDEKRLTKVGRFIRSTSIDELPQLINVLKGDMSFVGPRPFAVSYLPYYSEEEMHRHDVRPGITGLAQINGRKSIEWDKKIQYDLEYVKNLSFLLDLKIVFGTIIKVIKREGAVIDTGEFSNFNDYREAQWAAEGRQDLINKARIEFEKYMSCLS